MTDITFLSHVSRGFGALTEAAGVDGQLTIPVSVTVTAQPSGEDRTITRQIGLTRSCDVTTIDPGAIFRTDPDCRGDIRNFEPNYLPLVEFAAIDFPWRFSPARANGGRRDPWIALIVMATGEYDLRPGGRASDGSLRPPSLRVHDPAGTLPRSDQLGAWAHGQTVGDLSAVRPGDLDETDRSGTAATRSRLLAARKLKPRTEYLAALVPSTECGRRRGLDPEAPHDHATGPAWTPASAGPLDLPVYFYWRFATAAAGDIESLASALVPRPAGPLTGQRDLHVGPQPFGVPAAPDQITQSGALVAPDPAPGVSQPDALTAPLVAALNGPDDLHGDGPPDLDGASAVAPPLYGHWHADRRRLAQQDLDRPWFSTLNAAIAHRAAAGLGAEVARRHQEDLVAEAWRQVGDLDTARRKIDTARFGMLTAGRLHQRVFETLPDDAVVFMSRPAQARLHTSESATLEADLDESPLAGVATSALARASLAPRGALRAALKRATVAVEPATALTTLATSTTVPRPFSTTIRDPLLALAVDAEDTPDPAAAPEPFQPVNAATLADSIRSAFRPDLTIPGRIDGLIDGLDLATDDGLTAPEVPVPEIDTPMYAPLRDIAVSHLVPGIGDMAPNSVSLLAPNRAFIEAYMAGLNHEFARELLWRGFPAASLRVTYFRQFWESAGDHPDIAPIQSWRGPLGENGGTGVELVLVTRSDLIQRYPGLMVYAQRATFADGEYRLTETVAEPIFRAELAPDILALGFPVSEAAARGFLPPEGARASDHAAEIAANPGWFFILEEQPREARFGLDTPAPGGGHGGDWANVTWAHAAPDTTPDPATWHGPVDLAVATARTLPGDPPWNGSAAETALALLQQPFRVALHAQRLLPRPEEDT